MAKLQNQNTNSQNTTIERLEKRIEELENQLSASKKPSAYTIASRILNRHAMPVIEAEIDRLTDVRKAKEDAEKVLDAAVKELGWDDDGLKARRYARDIKRAKTVRELDDITDNIEADLELERQLGRIMTIADEIGFGEVFARNYMAGKAAVAQRNIC